MEWLVASLLLLTGFGARHIHAQKQLTAARYMLRQAKEEAHRIAILPMQNPYPLIQINKEGTLVFVNSAAVEHYPDLQALGIRHPVLEGLGTWSDTKVEAPKSRDIVYREKHYHQTIIPSTVGSVPSVIVYCYEITERKQYEHALRTQQSRTEEARLAAEQANGARGEFLATMSHELRTPMNGIINLTGMLLEASREGQQRDLLTIISQSAEHLLMLLNDILDFSKIEAGELAIERLEMDIRSVMKRTEALQRPVADRKGIKFMLEMAESVPATILSDPARLQQIMMNLTGNAIKFTALGSVTVRVDGEKRPDGRLDLRIAVQDTGIGIPKDKQHKLFGKFQQADSSTARMYGGTGLGLAISRNLVELLGGHVGFTSEEGKGTCFTVDLPVTYTDTPIARHTAQEGQKQIALRLDAPILIVDDNPVNLMVLNMHLKKIGFLHVDEADGGRAALQRVAARSYPLILMDCQMPEMDGFETTRRLRASEKERRTTIVAVTADAMKGAEEQCRAAGMDDYISKPIDKTRLLSLLAKWLPSDSSGENEEAIIPLAQPFGSAKANIPQPPVPLDFREGLTQSGSSPSIPVETHLDKAHLNDVTDGDISLQHSLIALFLKQAAEDINGMRAALQQRNAKHWIDGAHKLYGASVNIGAKAIAELCDKGQYLSTQDVSEILRLHQLIHQNYGMLRQVCDLSRKENIVA